MGWGQTGCERRIEVFVKIQKKKIFLVGVRGGGSGWGWGVGLGGVSVDVNEELKFLRKSKKMGGGPGGQVGGSGWM